jgi:hypothetical protein
MANYFWHKDRLNGALAFGRVGDDGGLSVCFDEGFLSDRQANCADHFEWHVFGVMSTSLCEWYEFETDADFAEDLARWYRKMCRMSHDELLAHAVSRFEVFDKQVDALHARGGRCLNT